MNIIYIIIIVLFCYLGIKFSKMFWHNLIYTYVSKYGNKESLSYIYHIVEGGMDEDWRVNLFWSIINIILLLSSCGIIYYCAINVKF